MYNENVGLHQKSPTMNVNVTPRLLDVRVIICQCCVNSSILLPPSGQKTVNRGVTPKGDKRGQEDDTVIYRQHWEQLMSKDWPSLLENKDPDQKRLDETLMGTNWHKVMGERRGEMKRYKQKLKRQEVLGWLTSQKGNMVGRKLVGLNWDFHCNRVASINASNEVPTANLVVTLIQYILNYLLLLG